MLRHLVMLLEHRFGAQSRGEGAGHCVAGLRGARPWRFSPRQEQADAAQAQI